MSPSSIVEVRKEFPALAECPDFIFGDAPTGTQFHESVTKAVTDYMNRPGAHLMGTHPGAVNTIRTTTEARIASAAFFNCLPEEVTFGPNMTSLTFHMARSIGYHLKSLPAYKHFNVVVMNLCHDANVSPWVRMAEDIGLEVRFVNFKSGNCTIDLVDFDRAVDEKTAFVALGMASNACGTINPVKDMIKQIRKVSNALTYVDAVHYAPHYALDVQDLDCDFCVASTFKFFGPHAAILFGRSKLMTSLRPYKLSVCCNDLPGPPNPNQFQRWETGTLNFEGIAGIKAVIDYIASLGDRFGSPKSGSLRDRIVAGYDAIRSYESQLTSRFLSKANSIPGLKIHGVKGLNSTEEGKRTPTFALRMECFETAKELADALLEQKIISGSGNFYAIYFSKYLGLEPTGGYVRIGFVHYNTIAEIDKVTSALDEIARKTQSKTI